MKNVMIMIMIMIMLMMLMMMMSMIMIKVMMLMMLMHPPNQELHRRTPYKFLIEKIWVFGPLEGVKFLTGGIA